MGRARQAVAALIAAGGVAAAATLVAAQGTASAAPPPSATGSGSVVDPVGDGAPGADVSGFTFSLADGTVTFTATLAAWDPSASPRDLLDAEVDVDGDGAADVRLVASKGSPPVANVPRPQQGGYYYPPECQKPFSADPATRTLSVSLPEHCIGSPAAAAARASLSPPDGCCPNDITAWTPLVRPAGVVDPKVVRATGWSDPTGDVVAAPAADAVTHSVTSDGSVVTFSVRLADWSPDTANLLFFTDIDVDGDGTTDFYAAPYGPDGKAALTTSAGYAVAGTETAVVRDAAARTLSMSFPVSALGPATSLSVIDDVFLPGTTGIDQLPDRAGRDVWSPVVTLPPAPTASSSPTPTESASPTPSVAASPSPTVGASPPATPPSAPEVPQPPATTPTTTAAPSPSASSTLPAGSVAKDGRPAPEPILRLLRATRVALDFPTRAHGAYVVVQYRAHHRWVSAVRVRLNGKGDATVALPTPVAKAVRGGSALRAVLGHRAYVVVKG
ncbi:hypothetical protein EV189_0916 [Motilibacter rhizosphaerae]|uniref:Uncharacterized protein n=1 Tax=Motilibacter rhizosphaerae TaxID=598652 RepID=A0A4V2F558_9ACTN|nr:hypothetical protein [Motilibacter rhizosphaerae]RZS91669.1 hypothetical protein EV189_0916 [Motilibacter rhizosphaerae]